MLGRESETCEYYFAEMASYNDERQRDYRTYGNRSTACCQSYAPRAAAVVTFCCRLCRSGSLGARLCLAVSLVVSRPRWWV